MFWDAAKDRSLWKVLLKTPKNSEMDWNDLSNKYEVPLTFLLQQAAYLYDRQFSQVRAQLRRVGASKSSTTSPIPGTESGGGEAMVRTGSTGQPQVASRATTGREATGQESGESAYKTTAGRTAAPPIGPNASASAAAAQLQSRYVPRASPRPAKAELHRRSMSPLASTSRPSTATNAHPSAAMPSSIVSSDGDESSSDSSLPMQSRLLRRPPRRPRSSDDEEIHDAPTFLPFTDSGRAAPRKQASASTLRDSPGQIARHRISNEKIRNSQTSDSSASSTAQHHPVSHRDPRYPRAVNAGSGMPPVPRRTAELAGRSPQSTGNGQTSRRESDRAPSMGSSFSDLEGEKTEVDFATLSKANKT